MTEPVWLRLDLVQAMHELQIDAFGGSAGVRDENLRESAIQRPLNRYFYEDTSDIAELAATYTEALTRNHPFFDGNKRTAFHAALVFLRLNGWRCVAGQAEAAAAVLRLTEGTLTRPEFVEWLRANSVRQS